MDLILRNVSCGYGRKVLLAGLNAVIRTGEVFCLLGPNGIGKTTLFKTILGFLPLAAGEILLDGRSLGSLSSLQKARLIGYVPQSQFTPFAFRVMEVVLMGRTCRLGFLGRPGRLDYEVSERVLDQLGIGSLRDRFFTELSGGEKQMVLIARALTQEPVFLMMDEPTSNLDFGNQALVLQSIRRLAGSGLGIILTTHFPDHVFQCGTQAVLLKPGGGFAAGPAAEVLTARNLTETYGLPVQVLSWTEADLDFRVCRPVFREAVPAESGAGEIRPGPGGPAAGAGL
ncbi:MAG: ABC transporter ATP-binding protein [Deltaproteobacteria bacterium]|jgi:iron complex transport system ATP-binding protein|nr:ABC transporter ATP-binding protein [Deltaproteobacteria bacterium]